MEQDPFCRICRTESGATLTAEENLNSINMRRSTYRSQSCALRKH